ncbi:MAG TPA: CoA transferase [Anaerolineae bacterium]|nr:CoA transferase [Anaerolineae bacterium]
MKQLALEGIRVIDLSRVLAGPYCTMMLADYGAEVIKVEQPGVGDGTRQWGPPWLGEQSAYFLTVNRNKRSMTLNLKSEAGREILHRLLAEADVLIENFKVGTMEKMGLGYEQIKEQYPGLIYCSISGYGQSGPYRERPGYDFMIQAEGGIMSITGPAAGEPHKVGVAVVDITTGLFAANGILTALHHRNETGRGQYIDVALFDTQLAWLANVAQNYLVTGEAPERYGNAHPNIVPYESFATADGTIAIAIGSDRQYQRFCEASGRPDLWEETAYQTNEGRVKGRERLIPALQELFRERTTAVWLELMTASGIPAAPINDIPTALNHPQAVAREMVQTVVDPVVGEMKLLGPVAKLTETPASIRQAPPLLGADTDEILGMLGYGGEVIAGWRAEGVI